MEPQVPNLSKVVPEIEIWPPKSFVSISELNSNRKFLKVQP
jgi:hypothetical protein